VATHDDPNASVKPVALRSANEKHVVEFVLRPLAPSQDQDWHSYEIHMMDPGSGKRASLTSSDERTLFLDKSIEPEIPALCAGIRNAVAKGTSYEFEPLDERDFRLEVAINGGHVTVKINYDLQPVSAEFGWPVGVVVKRDELLRFADELEASLKELVNTPAPSV
jgi:hypothetical protein